MSCFCCKPGTPCVPGPRPEEAYYLLDLTGVHNYHPGLPIGNSSLCHNIDGTPRQSCRLLNTRQQITLPFRFSQQFPEYTLYNYFRTLTYWNFSLTVFDGLGPYARDWIGGVKAACIEEDFRLTCVLAAGVFQIGFGLADITLFRNPKGTWEACDSICCRWVGTLQLLRRDDTLKAPVVTATASVESPTVIS